MTPLGIAIIGCGFMGSIHAERWSRTGLARVASVADIRAERAEKLARAYGLDQWQTDYRTAIDRAEVDAVSVCVPTHLHRKVTVFAAAHGKHVICEKPIALTLDDADAMRDAAERNHIKLMVGFMRRHSLVMDTLRACLNDGTIARPVLYAASDIRELRPKREMHDAHANGGPVIDMGVHLFSGWSYLFDSPPVAVSAHGVRLAQGRGELAHIRDVAIDSATISVCYASGDVGTFVVSWGLPPGVNATQQPDAIYAPNALVQVEWGMTHQQAQWTREGGACDMLVQSDADMYQNEINAFARCIHDDTPPRVTAADGKAALRVSLAALEAMQTMKTVEVGK